MNCKSVIVYILVVTLLSTSCATAKKEVIKINIPVDILRESIKVELELDKTVEVTTKSSTTPIKIIDFENDDVLSGVDSEGKEVKVAIDDIEEAWSLNTAYTYTKKEEEVECGGCGPGLWVVFSVITENIVAGLVLALGVSYAIAYGGDNTYEDETE